MGIYLVLLLSATFNQLHGEPFQTLQVSSSSLPIISSAFSKKPNDSLDEIKDMLHREAATLNPTVLDKVIRTLKCTLEYNVVHNNILTIIDYSLASNEKRLWVFDLQQKKLLFNTYVSHGIKSGTLFTNFFSNKFNSKASSVGVFKTENAYYGREGLSLRLDGLEASFNDNASNRSIVMHGGWYVSENFIKKYGRAGRSWGCPALPRELFQPIINTIKDNSLFVVYYPAENWLVKSKFLNCASIPMKLNAANVQTEIKPALGENELRDDVLLTNINKTEAIATMTADSYERIFQMKPPLGRMLRRQIDKVEYIALSTDEFTKLANNTIALIPENNQEPLSAINFVTPVIKMIRGYYETQMKILPMSKIKSLKAVDNNHYTVYFESNPALSLRKSREFIRWVGL
ncbi:MAG: murein L,D-transpeptidase catalytic domain family protein [Legionella sp.]|nr:murein L,D-transpeptidase catalytic domain family protein [Legionella sp.]